MQKRFLAVVCCLFLWVPGSAQPNKTPTQTLQDQIQKALEAPSLKKAKLGIFAQNLRTGEVLFAQNAEELLTPASNTKLVSTAAALYHLGPQYRFRTLFAISKDSRKGKKVSGDLFVKGFGDPFLMTSDLLGIADEIALTGVKEISGDVVVDGSFFDDQLSPPGFDDKPEVEATYRAVVAATSLNFNIITIRVFPGEKNGAPASVSADPDGSYLTIESDATTGKKTKLSVDCDAEKERLSCKVSGTIDVDAETSASFRRRALHPSLYFGHSLRAALASRGVVVKGAVKTGILPEKTKTLYTYVSDDLGTLVKSVNKHSNNFMAEMVLKTLGAEFKGAPGSSAGGIEATEAFLATIGIPKGSYTISNGSGLWGDTLFSASQMVKIMGAVYQDSRISPDFVSSLAISGADGTLRYRMKGTSASKSFRGKTGTLDGVICLSGYLQLHNQEVIAVSFLFNDITNAKAAKTAQSNISAAFAEYLIALDPKAAYPALAPDPEEPSEEE